MDLENYGKYSVKDLSSILYEGKGWIKLVGIVNIVSGAIYALSLVGILFAWIPIWMGILLNKASNEIAIAYENEDDTAMAGAMKNIKTYFIIQGILVLIGLIALVGFFAFGGLAILAGAVSNW